jgi:hypothetical protein
MAVRGGRSVVFAEAAVADERGNAVCQAPPTACCRDRSHLIWR